MAFQILVLIAGLVIGWVKKGSIWNFSNLRVRVWWILPISYVLQHISIFYLTGKTYELIIIVSYLFMLLFCVVNINVPGIVWALGGTLSNFITMSFNGLRMPAYIPAIQSMAPQIVPQLEAGTYGKSIAMSNTTHLNFLGDIFGFNVHPVSLLSIGDILFSIGLMILIQYAMRISGEGHIHAYRKS